MKMANTYLAFILNRKLPGSFVISLFGDEALFILLRDQIPLGPFIYRKSFPCSRNSLGDVSDLWNNEELVQFFHSDIEFITTICAYLLFAATRRLLLLLNCVHHVGRKENVSTLEPFWCSRSLAKPALLLLSDSLLM
jgi:hypothetical protein